MIKVDENGTTLTSVEDIPIQHADVEILFQLKNENIE